MTAPTRGLVEVGSLSVIRRGSPSTPSGTPAPQPTSRHPPTRPPKRLRRIVTIVVTVTMIAFPFLLTDPRSPLARMDVNAPIRLYSNGIATGPSGRPALIATHAFAGYLPGSRVLDPGPADPAALAGAETRAGQQRAWLAAGTVPGEGGPYAEMVAGALLDMHALTLPGGAAVAGWSARWRYVWPRDSSFVAVALATTGHPGDALAILTFLQRVQHRDGSFEARYLPDGSGPPDDRGLQSDGTGWALWATDAVLASIVDDTGRARAAHSLRRLIDRSTDRILDLTARRGTLPPASSDFWEDDEASLTLGTAAPLLSGLEAAARIYARLGDDASAAKAGTRAKKLRVAITETFGPRFARYPGGEQLDAAGAFLLPPFQPTALPGALTAWRTSAAAMARPAGGLAPGAGWRKDGISWTPQTALYGLTAAAVGDDDAANAWLSWIDAHRTPSGAIPEKVLGDGSPAAVAPLSWSAACVVLAVATLSARR